MNTIETTEHVGKIAAEHPLSARVFHRHGIDFCCGGRRALEEVCEAQQLDPGAIIQEIEAEEARAIDPPERWDQAPLAAVVDHILAGYHRPLDEELPRLAELARKVARVHADKAPELLTAVRETYLALMSELQQHMMKEEQVLFPMIKRGDGDMAGGPITVMQHEHDDAADLLARLNELTDGLHGPGRSVRRAGRPCGRDSSTWRRP